MSVLPTSVQGMLCIMPGDAPSVDRWDAWPPAEVARLLTGVATPWWVAGGWALDLWLGRQTRDHADVEICTPRAEWTSIRDRLAGHDLWCVHDGRRRLLAPGAPVPDVCRQVWVCDRQTRSWRLDVMLEAGGSDEWVCHRDPGIRRPLREATGATADRIPYLRPEIVLLLKAKAARPKDEADLDAFLPRLEPAARRWLARALAALHPGHRWLDRLG
jgi:hypothetical protein